MLTYNNIKKKDIKTDKQAKIILNIKDPNISFSKDYVSKERIHDLECTVFHAVLRNDIKNCSLCGQKNINHSITIHGYKEEFIQLIPMQAVPSYLHLFKQRFMCKNCKSTFTAKTYYVNEHCTISRPLLYAIALDLKHKISMKDIADRYFVSTTTVCRVLDTFYEEFSPKFNYLPENILIDEFKGPRDANGAMCFIMSDADTGKIIDILPDRRSFFLSNYFSKFDIKARNNVKTVVMDMNASYPSIIKKVLHKAKIIIDRFHIVQQITRAFNKQRVQAMNQFKKSYPEEAKNKRKYKRYWRIFLKSSQKIDYYTYQQFPLFKNKFMTESEVLDYLLSTNEELRQSYHVYQDLLYSFDQKDVEGFFEIIEHLPESLNTGFKKAILQLKKYKQAIIHTFSSPYTNGKLEGKNNLIKVMIRIAFGFRTFRNMKKRIMVQQQLSSIIK